MSSRLRDRLRRLGCAVVFAVGVGGAAALAVPATAAAAAYVVTTTTASGAGSLNAAITAAPRPTLAARS